MDRANKVAALVILAMGLAACDGRVVFAGNLVLGVVPCVMLWLTLNLKRAH